MTGYNFRHIDEMQIIVDEADGVRGVMGVMARKRKKTSTPEFMPWVYSSTTLVNDKTTRLLSEIDGQFKNLRMTLADMIKTGKIGQNRPNAIESTAEEIYLQVQRLTMEKVSLGGRIEEVRKLYQEERRENRVLVEKLRCARERIATLESRKELARYPRYRCCCCRRARSHSKRSGTSKAPGEGENWTCRKNLC